MAKGEVIVAGDFNARTKTLPDFIDDDWLHNSLLDKLPSYCSDIELPKRVNPDQCQNDYGMRLLNLCKATGLRIVNGRHSGGHSNDYTFNGARGMSTIDYLLSTPNLFDIFCKFIICNFTTFSDHAPLHIEL